MEISVHASMRGYMWKLIPTTDALRNRYIRHCNGKPEMMSKRGRSSARKHRLIAAHKGTVTNAQRGVPILNAVCARLSCCVPDLRKLTKRRLLPYVTTYALAPQKKPETSYV